MRESKEELDYRIFILYIIEILNRNFEIFNNLDRNGNYYYLMKNTCIYDLYDSTVQSAEKEGLKSKSYVED